MPAVVAGVAGGVELWLEPPPPHPTRPRERVAKPSSNSPGRRRRREGPQNSARTAENVPPSAKSRWRNPSRSLRDAVVPAVVASVSVAFPVPSAVRVTLGALRRQVGGLCAPVGAAEMAQLRFSAPEKPLPAVRLTVLVAVLPGAIAVTAVAAKITGAMVTVAVLLAIA